MRTTLELDELAKCLRKVLPAPRHLTRLETNESAGIVDVVWHSRHFAVTPVLDVVELKGQTLMRTGASILLQSSLRTQERQSRMASVLIETIRTAEDSMRYDSERGCELLGGVRETLGKLSGKSGSSKSNEVKEPAAMLAH